VVLAHGFVLVGGMGSLLKRFGEDNDSSSLADRLRILARTCSISAPSESLVGRHP